MWNTLAPMTRPVQDAAREDIIREVINSPLLPRLLQDGYGNYVVQVSLLHVWGPFKP